MVLAVVIFLSTQGFTAVVETIGGNEGATVNPVHYDNKKDGTIADAGMDVWVKREKVPENQQKHHMGNQHYKGLAEYQLL